MSFIIFVLLFSSISFGGPLLAILDRGLAYLLWVIVGDIMTWEIESCQQMQIVTTNTNINRYCKNKYKLLQSSHTELQYKNTYV